MNSMNYKFLTVVSLWEKKVNIVKYTPVQNKLTPACRYEGRYTFCI